MVICALLYADDLVLVADSWENLQVLLLGLESFCKKSKMNVNLKKTNIVNFSTKKSLKNIDLFFEEKVVEVKQKYLYLGTIFSMNGKFNEAVDQVLVKANIAAIQFWKYIKNFKFLQVSDIMRKFESLVLPILFYNCELWGPLICKTKMEQIEIFYRKILRRILKKFILILL